MSQGLTHQFVSSLTEGKQHEAELDGVFSKWFHVKPAKKEEDRRGIDRWFTAKTFPLSFSVQYKGDARAEASGNLFIELVSVSIEGQPKKPGWAIKCDADWLVMWLPTKRYAYILSVYLLKSWAAIWYVQYHPMVSIPNDGYRTEGIPVPIKIIEKSTPLIGIYKDGVISTKQQLSFYT